MPFCCYKPLERKSYFEHVLQTCCWGSDETNELLVNENRNPTAEHLLSLCMHYSGMYYPQTPEFPLPPPKVNASCLHLEFNTTFLCRACSRSRWDIWDSFSRAQCFFSSCHLKDLSCFMQEIRENGLDMGGMEWSVLVADPGEGFFAKAGIHCQNILDHMWENTGIGWFSSHHLLSNSCLAHQSDWITRLQYIVWEIISEVIEAKFLEFAFFCKSEINTANKIHSVT